MIEHDMKLIPRFYRLLLRLYPRDFYARFGAEMQTVFDQTWGDVRGQGFRLIAAFALRELTGLLFSIVHERWQSRGGSLLAVFRWRAMPFTLLAVSLIVAAAISLNYWGYITLPSSTFSALDSYESIALVEFDHNYVATALPIDRLPSLTTELFPPSQILPVIQQRNADIPVVQTIDPALVERLATALARENIVLGQERNPVSANPVLNPDVCASCATIGVQPQPDGSILEIMPMFEDGTFTGENIVNRVTANEWSFYYHVIPAGYLVRGYAEDGTPFVFAGISSYALQGGDHYHYYEFVFEDMGDRLIVRNHLTYNYDVAGLEGLGMFMITLVVYVPLMLVWCVLGIGRGVFLAMRRRGNRWQTA